MDRNRAVKWFGAGNFDQGGYWPRGRPYRRVKENGGPSEKFTGSKTPQTQWKNAPAYCSRSDERKARQSVTKIPSETRDSTLIDRIEKMHGTTEPL